MSEYKFFFWDEKLPLDAIKKLNEIMKKYNNSWRMYDFFAYYKPKDASSKYWYAFGGHRAAQENKKPHNLWINEISMDINHPECFIFLQKFFESMKYTVRMNSIGYYNVKYGLQGELLLARAAISKSWNVNCVELDEEFSDEETRATQDIPCYFMEFTISKKLTRYFKYQCQREGECKRYATKT